MPRGLKTTRKEAKKNAAAKLFPRRKAVAKLQISQSQFRRLCILKGVFPRPAPAGAAHLKKRTLYLAKDVAFMAHDPLVQTFRAQQIHRRRLARAKGRREPAKAAAIAARRPRERIDHVVKERFPTFFAALRGLDDALSMVAVFARHSARPPAVSAARVATCARLIREWEAYVADTRALRKAFVSVRGVYLQAVVHGVAVTWLQPHPFPLDERSGGVDYDVMATFLDFHEAHVAFVLFKLYADRGLPYPPPVDAAREAAGEHLSAVVLRPSAQPPLLPAAPVHDDDDGADAAQSETQRLSEARIATVAERISQLGNADDDDDDSSAAAAVDGVEEPAEDDQGAEAASEAPAGASEAAVEPGHGSALFEKCVFFLGRETPHRVLELLIVAHGGRVSWEGEFAAFEEDDASITHQIVDRPLAPQQLRSGRDYVQPQWLFDCVNEGVLLPVDEYALGVQPPPHLSPFVNDEESGYKPERREKLDELRTFLEESKREEDEEAAGAENEDEEMVPAEEEEEDDQDAIEARFMAELEAERKGKPFEEAQKMAKKKAREVAEKTKRRKETEVNTERAEAKQRTVGMMSSRNRRRFLQEERKAQAKEKQIKKLKARRNPQADARGISAPVTKKTKH